MHDHGCKRAEPCMRTAIIQTNLLRSAEHHAARRCSQAGQAGADLRDLDLLSSSCEAASLLPTRRQLHDVHEVLYVRGVLRAASLLMARHCCGSLAVGLCWCLLSACSRLFAGWVWLKAGLVDVSDESMILGSLFSVVTLQTLCPNI